LQAAVQAWEAHLLPLTDLVPPVPPSARLWPRITRSLDALGSVTAPAGRASAGRASFWRSLPLWRSLTAGGFAAAALAMALLLGQAPPPAPETRFMVVLVAPDDKAPGWVVQASTNQQVELIPLTILEVPA